MGGGGGFVSDIVAPVADVAAAVVAPELLPAMLTAEGIGAATGAGISALTGGNVLQGALGGAGTGAITGGLAGEFPATFSGLGGVMEAGGIGGGVMGALQGGNPLTGAAMGAAGSGLGYEGGQLLGGPSAATTAAATPTTGTGGGTSAVSTGGGVAPSSGISTDLTSPGGVGASVPSSGGTDPFSNLQSPSNGLNLGGTSLAGAPSNPTGGLFGGGNQLPAGTLNANPSGSDVMSQLTGAGATGSTPSGSTGGNSFKSFLNNPSLGSAGNVLASNPALTLGALGLGASALTSQQQPKGYNQLAGEAGQLASQGAQLQQSLNGALPAGAQSALNQASNSAKARIRSQYAASGLSGSTMEAQALAGVDETVAAQGFQMADQLYQQGVQESGMAANLYQQIMAVNAQSDAALSSSIGNFSAALAGAGVKS